jgi:hypothetical protein
VTVLGTTTVPHGATRDFTAEALFADGGTRDVTEGAAWTSLSPTVISVSTTAGVRGRVTGLTDTGSAQINAIVTSGAGNRGGSATPSAAVAERRTLFVVPRLSSIAAGGTVGFRALFSKSDGTAEDVTSAATWSTSNSAAATVAGGVATGVAGTGRLAGVSVTAPAGKPVGDSAAAAAAATFAPSVGGDPTATVTDAVSWFSSDPVALPIAASGVVTTRRTGIADVAAAFGGIASTAQTATGSAAVERTVSIFPQAPKAGAGVDVQLAAQVTSSDGAVADHSWNCTWNSASTDKATVDAWGKVHAVAKGTSVITCTRTGLPPAQATFTTLSDPPSISSVVASPLSRGTTGNLVTINGANLDGSSLSVIFSGSGVTAEAAPTPSGDGTSATVLVTVASGAATGARDLTYTTAGGSATKTNAVTVVSVSPTIVSISPTNIDVPSAGTTLTVTGTNFGVADTFVLESASGVSLSNVQVGSTTSMTGTVTVQSGTTPVRLDVTVQQSAAAGGQTATLTDALKIGPPDATLTSFTPGLATPPGSGTMTFPVRIVGTNFLSGITASISGSSATGQSFTRQSSTLITGTFSVASSASFGAFDLTLQNPGDASRTFTGVLAVAPRDPTVTSFSAASVSRGASNLAVEIYGTNFRSGDTVSASGGGVTFGTVTVVSSEKLTTTISAASNATVSLRDLSVAHASSIGGRSGTLRNAFRVSDAAPTVTAINPSRIGRTGTSGPTRRVPVVLTGTNFCVGATVTTSLTGGAGLSVAANSTTVVSDTQIACSLDVAGATTTGAWNVTVANPASLGNSGSTGNGLLTIVNEATLAVNNVVAATGSAQGGERVTVYGSGFVRGLTVDFGTERAPSAQYIDPNTAVCIVPPPANPSSASGTSISRTSTTSVGVKVTIVGGANATLTNGYSYLANQTPFKILQSFPADGSTNVPQNLKSAVVRLSDYANTTSAVFGNTQGTNCQWFEAGAQRPTGMTGGFGADRRFLVFSRTSGGNLPIASTGRYVLETPTAVKSAAGAPLVPAKLAQTLAYDQWFFTLTSSTTDQTAPSLSSSVPAGSATGVSTNTAVTLTFSEEIDPLTVTANTITLAPQGGGGNVACVVALSNDIRTVTLTPLAELATNTTYVATVTTAVADLFGNAISSTTRTFTTGSGTDTTAPTVDTVVFEEIPASMDGSTTYVAGTDTPSSITNGSASFRLYLPRSGWKVTAHFSDTGGSGIDETQFSALANVTVGSSSAGAQLASKFTTTSTSATWTVASSDAFASGDGAMLTFTIKDKAGNTSASKVVTVNLIDITATAVGGAGSQGGDLDPFNSRETWVLRFDRDVYTATLSTNGSTQQCQTAASANGVLDIEEAMRIPGLATANMTSDCSNTVNGSSVGTNAIVRRLLEERIRASLRARFGIGQDGSRGADSADIEFLLPGEQGSLSGLPTWSSTSSASTGLAYSQMDIGGDTGPNSSQTGTFSAIGYAWVDPRNRSREANMNDGQGAGNNTGIFAINMAKSVMNSSVTGTTYGAQILARFQTAKGGTPVGEHSLDDDVLAGSYDRTSTSGSNTQQMKDRYDQIMDAIEVSAASVSSVTAHEMGHSMGLVQDGGPKTGFFGNAPKSNTFTEAVTGFDNTPGHLNYLGNDIMAPVSSVDQRSATGTDFMKFSPFDRNYFLRRQVFDEGR